MASGRMLQRRISKNEAIALVAQRLDESMGYGHGAYAALLFTWAIAHQDVEGRIEGDPRIVRGNVFPMLEWVTSVHVGAYLGALGAAGLLVWYEVAGKRYVWFPGFDGAQPGLRRDREGPSLLPSPEGAHIVGGTFTVEAGVTPAELPADSAVTAGLKSEVRSLKLEDPSGRGTAFAAPTGQGAFGLATQEPPKPKKLPAPEVAEAITYFQRRWVELRSPADGQRPTMTDADKGQLIRLLKSHGLEPFKGYVDRFLSDEADFLVESGHALKHLPSRIDGYRVAKTGTRKHIGHAQPAPHNTETREHDL